jgi:hypothetical protein
MRENIRRAVRLLREAAKELHELPTLERVFTGKITEKKGYHYEDTGEPVLANEECFKVTIPSWPGEDEELYFRYKEEAVKFLDEEFEDWIDYA